MTWTKEKQDRLDEIKSLLDFDFIGDHLAVLLGEFEALVVGRALDRAREEGRLKIYGWDANGRPVDE
jgi:hypothetical protein